MSRLTLPLLLAASLLAMPALVGLILPESRGEDPAPPFELDARDSTVVVAGIPHVRQRPDFCGEACVEMVCRKLGVDLDQDDVFNHAGLAPEKGRGCHTRELSVALRALGFETGPTGSWIPAAGDPAGAPGPSMERAFQRIVAGLRRGDPSIVCMRYDERPDTTEHFRLITGYDAESEEVIYHEPAEARGAYRRMSRRQFFSLWPLKYKPREWLLIQFDLAGRDIRGRVESRDAAFAQHVLETKRFLAEHAPERDFHIAIRDPFVVIGDEPAAAVKRRADGTVAWACRMLRRQFFEKSPEDIIDIWLFADKASYEKHLWAFWKTRPFTPFGYFSSEHSALVMNIGTGGGTLVHEIVHPYVKADFPGCASWVDEGIASLFEQSMERGGKIRGLTNWRLAGLQRAIKHDRVPPFRTLCNTTRHQFYEEDPGTNYSQARYLMYYLQEKGLLEKFYKQYRAGKKDDPTGWKTLQAVLGQPDMEAFQAGWQKWVAGLEFR